MDENSPSLSDLLTALQTITQRMFELAQQGELDPLPQLQQQRQKLTDSYQRLSVQQPQQVTEQLAAQLQTIAQLDQQMLTLCGALRDELSSQLKGISKNKKASQAYQKNQR